MTKRRKKFTIKDKPDSPYKTARRMGLSRKMVLELKKLVDRAMKRVKND